MIEELPGVLSQATWGLRKIGAPQRANEGQGVHVYILDTGIRVTHREFGGRAVPTVDMSSGNLLECKGALDCAGDAQGHGTHCAGTATGATFGVAPQATVHAIKVLSDEGSGSWAWSYDALDWLATKGVKPSVASMSLGGSGNQNAMKVAVDGAVSAGVTVVVAGGNENSNACGFSPAFVPSAITVGSTTSTDTRSDFSNYGSCVDFWAPGSDVVSAMHTSDTDSVAFSGTSMACPHVSGAVALLLENGPVSDPLSELKANAVWNGIGGLRTGDTNAFLYVGAEGPPPTLAPVPTLPSACDPSFSTGPDSDGDCKCLSGIRCHQKGDLRCEFSIAGRTSTTWFLATCVDCECL